MPANDPSLFQVAIFCALRIESEAIEAIFDEIFGEEDSTHYDDEFNEFIPYKLGRIGFHHVVLAYTHAKDKVSSVSAAVDLHGRFPNIRLGLVVGICGGIPQLEHSEEIFLADVIVSTGVVKYDEGQQLEGKFIRPVEDDGDPENPTSPFPEIVSFLDLIQKWSGRRAFKNLISTYIEDICDAQGLESWSRPSSEEDKLYQADYLHKHHNLASCIECARDRKSVCDVARNMPCKSLQCDENKIVARKRDIARSGDDETCNPRVHFGHIASGDVIMRSSTHRDRIAAEDNILGFETGGGGMWSFFPTLIVKGVCNYSDSHRNKSWQKHASVTAAACAKILLGQWRPTDPTTPPWSSVQAAKKSADPEVIFNNNGGKVLNQAVTQSFSSHVTFG